MLKYLSYHATIKQKSLKSNSVQDIQQWYYREPAVKEQFGVESSNGDTASNIWLNFALFSKRICQTSPYFGEHVATSLLLPTILIILYKRVTY
jgi:hypothetical protein